MRIDAHQHFWRIGRDDCVWPTPELTAIYRDFGPDDFMPLAASRGVEGTVLVQSQPSDRDTDALCALAARTPLVQALVGWVDLAAPGAIARLEALAARPKVRGVRPMLQSLPDDAWIARPELDNALAAMADLGLAFDALVFPHHLPSLLEMASRRPNLRIVIDHAAKPPIRTRALQPWRDRLTTLGELPNVYCKLSGLLTEAQPGDGDDILLPYVGAIFEAFGEKRVMWGSDWPVIGLASGYADWFDQANRLAVQAGAADPSLLCGRVASVFYGIL